MNEIIDLISNVGFPIAACIFLFVQQNKLTKAFNDLSATLTIMSDRIDSIEGTINKRKERNNGSKKED